MGASGGPRILTDRLKLLIDPKDDACNGGKSIMTDLSGNLNSGSLYTGNGLRFDGVDDWAPIADSSLWDFGTGNFSISCWVRLDTNPLTSDGLVGAIEGGDGSNNGWTLHLQLDSSDISGRFYYLSGGSGLHVTTSPTFTADSKFHHVVAVRDGDSITVYGDGVAGTATTGVASTSINSSTSNEGITLGSLYAPSEADNNADNNLLNGSLSDVRIYHGALSSADVSELYNKPNTVLPGNVSGSQLKGWWPLTERNGTTAYDGSGNGNHSSFNSTPMWVSSSADIPQLGSKGFSKKMVFNGSDDNDYVRITDAANLSFGDGSNDNQFTISAWIYPYTTDGDDFVIINKPNEWQLWYESNYVRGRVHDNSSTTNGYSQVASSVTPVRKWHHVAMTYDGRGGNSADDGLRIIINGTDHGGSTATDSNYVAMENTTNNVHIGSNLSTGNRSFDGIIDEVAIWNVTMSIANGLRELAATSSYGLPTPFDARTVSGSNLVGYWRNGGIEASGSWDDLSGNENHGFVHTGSAMVEIFYPETHIKGRDSQGMFLSNPNEGWFDLNTSGSYGGSDYILSQDIDALDGIGALTMECWVNLNSRPDDWYFLIHKHASIGIYRNPSGLYGGQYPYLEMWVASGKSTQSNADLRYNTWQHCVGVFDGTNNILTYIDGKLSVGSAAAGPATTTDDSSILYIGRESATDKNLFHGKITGVKIYDRVLSPVEIVQNYNAMKSRFT
jgi:hypothetical protein